MNDSDFRGKRILVVGAGVSGISAALILKRLGAIVTLSDAKKRESLKIDLSLLENEGVNLALERKDTDLLKDIDCLVVSPGVPIDIPLIEAAKSRGITVMSEVEMAYLLCPAKMLAVTGTNGKTTTTALLGEMMKTTGKKVLVGGNIGAALSEVTLNTSENDIVVAEISSFQLEGVISFRPHIAILLNITPDHLDRHYSMENYQAMKERIFLQQGLNDFAVLNYDDPIVRCVGLKLLAKTQVVYFSRSEKLEEGVFVEQGKIKIIWQGKEIEICPVDDIKILGAHNIENALAATAAAFLGGAEPSLIHETLKTFKGVEHRLEFTAKINGVSYYNDSKATNPESAVKALESFSENIVLIAGGRDKNTDLTDFMNLAAKKTAHLILIGEAAERFAAAAAKHGIKNIEKAKTLAEAVTIAKSLSHAPGIVLLSPACASFDMFDNFEERGREFKRIVGELA
jgi:UDP-N-acetylmuramoylalanine--D-glutamate ligase